MINLVLFSASPSDTAPLRVDHEFREINDTYRRSNFRDEITIHTYLSARHSDLRKALLNHQPNIVHFSGHGTKELLLLENNEGKSHQVRLVDFYKLLGMFENIDLIFINSCYSGNQHRKLLSRTPYIITINEKVRDKDSITFSAGFYEALFNGKMIEASFEVALNSLILSNPTADYSTRSLDISMSPEENANFMLLKSNKPNVRKGFKFTHLLSLLVLLPLALAAIYAVALHYIF